LPGRLARSYDEHNVIVMAIMRGMVRQLARPRIPTLRSLAMPASFMHQPKKIDSYSFWDRNLLFRMDFL